MRIDAHQHYWVFDAERDAWIDDTMAPLQRDFLPEDVAPLLDVSGFDGVVAIQAGQSESQTDFLLKLAATDARMIGVVGWIDITARDLDRRLAQWAGERLLKGFRHIAQSEPDGFLARPEVAAGITRLGAHGYTFDILIRSWQIGAAQKLVARCPNVRFVLDHCAKPPIRDGKIDAWRRGMKRLAAYPNVVCKISGLVTEASWNEWIFDDLTPYLDVTLDAFGVDRILFGSDWPVCLVAADWYRVLGVVERWSAAFSDSERAALFGGTAARVYGLGE